MQSTFKLKNGDDRKSLYVYLEYNKRVQLLQPKQYNIYIYIFTAYSCKVLIDNMNSYEHGSS